MRVTLKKPFADGTVAVDMGASLSPVVAIRRRQRHRSRPRTIDCVQRCRHTVKRYSADRLGGSDADGDDPEGPDRPNRLYFSLRHRGGAIDRCRVVI